MAACCESIIPQDGIPSASISLSVPRSYLWPRANASHPMPRIPTQPSCPAETHTTTIIDIPPRVTCTNMYSTDTCIFRRNIACHDSAYRRGLVKIAGVNFWDLGAMGLSAKGVCGCLYIANIPVLYITVAWGARGFVLGV